jgi:hypothetical protein
MNLNLINIIYIYDMRLEEKITKGESGLNRKEEELRSKEWLYVKGVDTRNNVVNNKYLVQISNNAKCERKFKRISRGLQKYYNEQLQNNKFIYWK